MMHFPGEHYRTIHLPLPSERHEANRRTINRVVWLLWALMMLLAASMLAVALFPQSVAAAECGDGLRLEVGIGVHDPGIDGPEYTTRNPLGIVAARYHQGPWVFSFEHSSSLEGFPAVFDSPHEYGYGANVLSVRYGWWL